MNSGTMDRGLSRLLMGIAVWAVAMACAVPGREAGSPAAVPSSKASSSASSTQASAPPTLAPSPANTAQPSTSGNLAPASAIAASATTTSAKADSAEPIPDFKVELQGGLLTESGKDSIFMTLASNAQRLSGSIRIGSRKPSRITEAKLTALNKPSWEPAVHARFRLDFAVDGCEHIAARPPAATYQWGPCFYYAEDRKPVYPQWGEAWIDFNGITKAFTVTAAGTNDVLNLSGVFRMTGVARK
jgi:hypothetical protein